MWLTKKLLCWVHSQAVQNQGMKKDRETQEDPASTANIVTKGKPKVWILCCILGSSNQIKGEEPASLEFLKTVPLRFEGGPKSPGLVGPQLLGPHAQTPEFSQSGEGPGQIAGPRCGVGTQLLMKGAELLILNRVPILGGLEEEKKPFLSNFLDSLAEALEIKLTKDR